MTQKALFLDLDGTLMMDDKSVSAENKAAIEKALSLGHKVIITTGRPLKSAILQAKRLGLYGEGCYLIAFNGGLIYDTGNETILYEKTIPLPVVKQLFEKAERMYLHIQTYDHEDVLVDPKNDDETLHRYCNIIEMTYRTLSSVDDLTEEPIKLLAIDLDARPPLQEFQDYIAQNFAGQLDTFFSCEEYLEIVPPKTSKGDALLALCKELSLPISSTIAVGDAGNDLSMIEAAGLGVAMVNGTASVKAVADYITEADNNHHAIREVIEKFML